MSATTTFTHRGVTSHQDVLAKVCDFSLHNILAKLKRCLFSVYREQQLTQGHSASSTARLAPAVGGFSLATLSQLSKTSNNSNTVGANSRADRWHRLRSTSYHMHDCCLPQQSSVTDHPLTGTTGAGTGVNGTAYGCGVMFTEAENQSLNQLLVATVDVLVDSGTPNVGIHFRRFLWSFVY